MKKLISTLSIVALLSMLITSSVSAVDTVADSAGYSDLKEDYTYYEAVMYLTEKGLIKGNTDGTFAPERVVNRAEMAKMIVEAYFTLNGKDKAELDAYSSKTPFSDVAANQWYTAYIAYAKEKGWVKGYDGNVYKPGQELTFVEGLKIGFSGLEIAFTEPATVWYKDLVFKASEKNYIPLTMTEFNDPFKRAEVAEMLTRALKDSNGKLAEYLAETADYKVTYETLTAKTDVYAQMMKDFSDASEMLSVVDLAMTKTDLLTFVSAVKAAELVSALETKGPFTVFAPTDLAFDAVDDAALAELLMPENKDKLVNLLKFHVVAGDLLAANLKDGDVLKTLSGDKLTVTLVDGKTKINGSTVSSPDHSADNGTIHMIDTVLTPPVKQMVNYNLGVQNLTAGTQAQDLSGGLLVVHTCSINLLAAGSPVSTAWESFAEWGDYSALKSALLAATDKVYIVMPVESAAKKAADATEAETVVTTFSFEKVEGVETCVSYAAMPMGANDGMVVARATLPSTDTTATGSVLVWDVGTEENSALNSGFAGGQYDASKTLEENMNNGTATSPKANVAVHTQLTDLTKIVSMEVMMSGDQM